MRVDISGGEPTLRRDLPSIAQVAIDAGLNVIVSTNGLVLGPDALPKFPAFRWHVSVDSGIPGVHEQSRVLPTLDPRRGGFEKTMKFILSCIERQLPVRALTCIGWNNRDELFALGERLAIMGVQEWNISRVLKAGRARSDYERRWSVDEAYTSEQVHELRKTYPSIRIRYSNRTEQNGYFLLVLPDGSLATQFTDDRDKVIIGSAADVTLQDLENSPHFNLEEHCRKWICAYLPWQPFHPYVNPDLWDKRCA